MDLKLEYYSTIKNGRLQKNVSETIAKELGSFEGKRVCLTIQKLKSTRSTQQNRLYWLYISIIAKELGFSKDELHDVVKYKFLRREKVFEKTGEVVEYLESTSRLTKTEFGEFINDLVRWCAETFDISLPMPNEQMEIEID